MTGMVGEKLWLRSTSKKPFMDCELETGDRWVASLSLYGGDELARMVCADGAWVLKKRLKYGWELVIESSDGRHVGWYSGRHWLPGGTIFLAGGAQVDLRRSLYGGWKLQVTETHRRIMDMRGYGFSRPLTIRSLPAEIYSEAQVVVLTTCAVLMLSRSVGGPGPTG